MPKAYSYIRFSSKKQEQGDSYRRQRALSKQWIEDNREKLGVYEDTTGRTYEDLGVSGFDGANLDEESGALGAFIGECRDGNIEKGSYLILEQLDRFSRAEPLEAASLISKIVKRYGLKIVVLRPTRKIITKESLKDIHQLLIIILELAAAHSYSVTLSNRLKDDWKKRRDNTSADSKLNTKNVPSWIDLTINDKEEYHFDVNVKAAQAIDYIFKRILDGIPQRTICAELNKKFPPIAKKTYGEKKNTGNYWTHSYVNRLIQDRRLIGEFQLYKKNDEKKMVPSGEPIKNYFPIIIDEDTFYKAQSVKQNQKRFASIKRNSKYINIFRGLITCDNDNHKMYLKPGYNTFNGKRYEYRRLASYGKKIGLSNCSLTIDYEKFEDLIIDCLGELRAVDIKEVKDNKKEVVELEQVIHGINLKLEEIRRRLNSDKYAEEYGANLDREKDLRIKLKEKEDVLSNISRLQPRSKQDILNDLKIFRPKNLSQEDKYNLRKQYLKILPNIIQSINITMVKFKNRFNGAYGVINLTSGKKRFFIFNPESNIDDVIFHDNKNNPVWLLTKNGSVFWQKSIRGKNYENVKIRGKYKRADNQVYNDEIDNPFKILESITKKFGTDIDFGLQFSTFTGIPDIKKLEAIIDNPSANIKLVDYTFMDDPHTEEEKKSILEKVKEQVKLKIKEHENGRD
jgi:hypothetical protein